MASVFHADNKARASLLARRPREQDTLTPTYIGSIWPEACGPRYLRKDLRQFKFGKVRLMAGLLRCISWTIGCLIFFAVYSFVDRLLFSFTVPYVRWIMAPTIIYFIILLIFLYYTWIIGLLVPIFRNLAVKAVLFASIFFIMTIISAKSVNLYSKHFDIWMFVNGNLTLVGALYYSVVYGSLAAGPMIITRFVFSSRRKIRTEKGIVSGAQAKDTA